MLVGGRETQQRVRTVADWRGARSAESQYLGPTRPSQGRCSPRARVRLGRRGANACTSPGSRETKVAGQEGVTQLGVSSARYLGFLAAARRGRRGQLGARGVPGQPVPAVLAGAAGRDHRGGTGTVLRPGRNRAARAQLWPPGIPILATAAPGLRALASAPPTSRLPRAARGRARPAAPGQPRLGRDCPPAAGGQVGSGSAAGNPEAGGGPGAGPSGGRRGQAGT